MASRIYDFPPDSFLFYSNLKVSQANSQPFKKTLGQNVLTKPTAASKAEDENWLGMYPQSTPGNCDRCVQSIADSLHQLPWFPSPSSSAGFTLSIEKNLAETSATKERLHGLLAGFFYLILAPYIFLPPAALTVPHWNQSVKSLREGKRLSASEDLSGPTPGPLQWALQRQSNLVTEGGRLTEIMTFRGLDYFEDQSVFDPRSDTGFLIAPRGAHWVASASFSRSRSRHLPISIASRQCLPNAGPVQTSSSGQSFQFISLSKRHGHSWPKSFKLSKIRNLKDHVYRHHPKKISHRIPCGALFIHFLTALGSF